MSDERLNRFARGELSPAESRELAQQALGDGDLFDELTATALARTALVKRGTKILTWPRVAMLVAAAVVALGIALYTSRRNSPPTTQVASSGASSSAPIFLAHAGGNTSVFRGDEPGSRAPKAAGSIDSIVGRIATIDLGSLDGLVKGAEIEAIRDGKSLGTIRLGTIFRERSRGEIGRNAGMRPGDQVRVPPAIYLRAILDQIDAAVARGDSSGARQIAQQASVDRFEVDAPSAEDLNNAALIAELHGNKSKAIELFEGALETSPPQQKKQIIAENLARARGAN
ncbi:MAG TPA: hypothetical protein VKS01_07645 [Bryobacteraceae bacterium]|nr:hypothetical protein [Bryobacteraceae bacterium]